MKKVIAIGSLFITGLPVTVFQGYTVAKLWGWFVVPLGVPSIGWAHGVGLSTLLDLFLAAVFMKLVNIDPYQPSEKTASGLFARGVGVQVGITFVLLMSWLYGWIATLFM